MESPSKADVGGEATGPAEPYRAGAVSPADTAPRSLCHGHSCCEAAGLSPPNGEQAQGPETRMGSIMGTACDFGPSAGEATTRFSSEGWASETGKSIGSSVPWTHTPDPP